MHIIFLSYSISILRPTVSYDYSTYGKVSAVHYLLFNVTNTVVQ